MQCRSLPDSRKSFKMGTFVSISATVAIAVVVLHLAATASPPKDAPLYEFANGENHTTFLLRGCIQVLLTYPTAEGGHETATLNLSGVVPTISQSYVNSSVSGDSYLTTYLAWSEGFTLSFGLTADFSSSKQWWVRALDLSFSPSPLLPNSTLNSTGHLRQDYKDLFMTRLGRAYTCAAVSFELSGDNVDASATVVIDDFELQGYVFLEDGAFSPDASTCPKWSLARDLIIPVVVFLLLLLVGALAITVYIIGMSLHKRRTRKYRIF